MSIPLKPFNYTRGFPSVTVSGTTASSQVRLDANSPQIYVYNSGPDLIYIRWGVNNQTAVSTDVPVPVGSIQIFTKDRADTLAGICPNSTATLVVVNGAGY